MKKLVPFALLFSFFNFYAFSQVDLLVDITPTGTWQGISDIGTIDGIYYYSFKNAATTEIKRYVNNSWENVPSPSGYESPHFLTDLPDGNSIWYFIPTGGSKSELFLLSNTTFSSLALPAASATKNWIGITYAGSLDQQHFFGFTDRTTVGSATVDHYDFYSYSNGTWSAPITTPHNGNFSIAYKEADILYIGFSEAGKLTKFDGTTWMDIAFPTSNIIDFSYLDKSSTTKYFIFYGNDDTSSIYSFDGTTWTLFGESLPGNLVELHQPLNLEQNIWDAFEANFENQALLQYNGTTWNTLPLPASSTVPYYYLSPLAIVNGQQYFSFNPNDGDPTKIFYTADGQNWTEVSVPTGGFHPSGSYSISNSPFIKMNVGDFDVYRIYKIPGILCEENTIPVNYQMISSGTYQATDDLTSSGRIECTENVFFKAGNCITLQSGFEVDGAFSATIETCSAPTAFTAPLPTFKSNFSTTGIKLTASPNPFSTATTISYQLPSAGPINLTLTNTLGQPVKKIVSKQYAAKGNHQLQLVADNLDKGLYFLVLEQGKYQEIQKLYLH